MRSLVVEDDPSIRKMVKALLSMYGECEPVVDGRQAVQTFEMALEDEEPYDLICMDIMMPGKDGLEALIEIREIEREMGVEEEKKVKVIMLTAVSDPGTMFEASYEGGATAYITKPFETQDIVNELYKLGLIQ